MIWHEETIVTPSGDSYRVLSLNRLIVSRSPESNPESLCRICPTNSYHLTPYNIEFWGDILVEIFGGSDSKCSECSELSTSAQVNATGWEIIFL